MKKNESKNKLLRIIDRHSKQSDLENIDPIPVFDENINCIESIKSVKKSESRLDLLLKKSSQTLISRNEEKNKNQNFQSLKKTETAENFQNTKNWSNKEQCLESSDSKSKRVEQLKKKILFSN